MEKMIPRDRMRAFLSKKPVDRIPNGLGGCETAGLHNIAYHRLKNVLGVDDPANRISTFMCNAIFEPPVLKAMEGDIILLNSRMCPSRFWGPKAEQEWKQLHIWDIDLQVANEWEFRKDPDGSWWWWDNKCPPGGLYFDGPNPSGIGSGLADVDVPSPDEFKPGHELPEEWMQRLNEDAKWLYENTEFSITCGETIQDLQFMPGGMQSWWMRLVSDPKACHEFLAKAVDASLAQLKQLDEAVGEYCDMLLMAHDIGDGRGVTIGPDLWREIYKPHYKRLFTEWHNITSMKSCLHCCGAVSDILPDLAECGLDVYNPVQVSADNMDPNKLKEKVNNKLIFYGGSYDAVLNPIESSPDEVYERVKANIKALSKGGGYIFAGVHNLPGDMPEEHIRAMLEAYKDCRVL